MVTVLLAIVDGTTTADFGWLYIGTVLIDLTMLER